MPIFVDEVVISVEVTEPSAPAAEAAKPPAVEDRQALVAECVERVLEVLAAREER
jgi:hypothetical protein